MDNKIENICLGLSYFSKLNKRCYKWLEAGLKEIKLFGDINLFFRANIKCFVANSRDKNIPV